MKKLIQGLLIGFIVGVIDVSIFKFAFGFPVTGMDALGAISFWIVAGIFIHTSSLQMQSTLKGIVISILMGIPWMIDYYARGKTEEIVMLAIIFLVYGALTGFLSGRNFVGIEQNVLLDSK